MTPGGPHDPAVAVEARSKLTCDAGSFHLAARVTAFEGDDPLSQREWRDTIPRDFL